MGNVTDLAAFKAAQRPHIQGRARCLHCHHEWQAVVPVDDQCDDLECSACGLMRGVFVHNTTPGPGHLLWVCNCGSSYFYWVIAPETSRRGIMCIGCGVTTESDVLLEP